jgi:DNA replication protein DnaC
VPASKVGSELLFDVISTAYERTSLIVTTNLPFESWTEVLGSERSPGQPSTGSRTDARSSRRKERATGSKMPRPGATG